MRIRAQAGFTMMELLVVMAIIGMLSGVLMLNFRSTGTSATARLQTANVVVSDIRRIQSMALSGSTYQGLPTCGYGIHYVDSMTYQLYARLASSGVPCKTDPKSRNMSQGDPVVEARKLINASMSFGSVFADIFFEIPDPTTYINNSSLLSQSPAQLSISATKNPSESVVISVFASGKVDIQP